MCGTYDQRYRYPYQVDTFSVPRSYFACASDDSDLESPVGGGGGGSADNAGSGSSQSTPQQSQNLEFTQHSQQDSPHIPSHQGLPQVSTPSTHRVSLPPVHHLNAALPEQSAAPTFGSDNRNPNETYTFQQFDHLGTQSPILSGDGGQSEFVTLPPLIGRNYAHPSVAPSSSSASLASHDSSTVTPSVPSYSDAGDYLRHQLGLAPGTPVNLDCLPDPSPGQRPPQAYPVLIKLAIYGSPKKMLTLKGIYEAIEERFEFFNKDKSGAWKRSIRHNLSLNRVFKNIPRPISEPGKGSYWELDLSQGEGYKRERKRRKRGSSAQQQVRSRQGQQESETDSQSAGEEEEESEISSPSRSESPAQREGRNIGPHRLAHAMSLSRRSSPYPAGEPTMRPRAASPAWAPRPGHAYAGDATRAETPWGPGYAGGQGQVPQVGGYAQPPFPLPMAMAGQEFAQQPVFRSGPFAHTVAWHAQQQMRQQSFSGHSSVTPQFPYTSSMFSASSDHFQLGGAAVPSPIIAGNMREGSGQPGSAYIASPIVAGAVHTGDPQLESLTLPSLVAPGTVRTGNPPFESFILPSLVVPGDNQYRSFGQGQIDGEPEEDGSGQGGKSRHDRQESRRR